MNSLDRVENLIAENTEGYFDDPENRESLHITIRIASDFYQFLLRFDDQPPGDKVDYTIRIRLVFRTCFPLRPCNRQQELKVPYRFQGGVSRIVTRFECLARDPDLSAEKALAALLGLTQLEFMFLAQHFPSAL